MLAREFDGEMRYEGGLRVINHDRRAKRSAPESRAKSELRVGGANGTGRWLAIAIFFENIRKI
jgi:hypothetical protein